MKNINIFCFSGTGNTWWVSEQITTKLQERGIEAKTYSIEQITTADAARLVNEADVIGLGFPIYGSDAPRIFHDFIADLPKLKEPKDTLGFVTQMMWSGDGCNFLENQLKEKGYQLRWSMEFNMPNNIMLPLFPVPYSGKYPKFERMLKRNKKRVENLCEKMRTGKEYRQHNDLFSRGSAWIQRGPFRLVHDAGREWWSVDPEACTSCERCARLCPVENIVMMDGLPVHKDKCVYCMRCFNYCPTYAIAYAGMSNKRVKKKAPFLGPVKEFKPELIIKKES